MIHDLRKLKKAKILVEDLQQIIRVMDLTVRALEPYKQYVTAKRLQLLAKEEKILSESYLSHYEKFIKNKGRIE
jgi:hypothetical protein